MAEDAPFDERYAVVDAVHLELAEIAKRDPGLAKSAVAMGALALARELDCFNSATSKSNCQKELRDSMAALWALAPAKAEASPLDEIKSRRDAKLGRPGAANRVDSAGKSAS